VCGFFIFCDIKGVTAKVQMAKHCFCFIFKTLVPTPIIIGELWGVGGKLMKMKYSEAKEWQKQYLAFAFLLLHPLGSHENVKILANLF
jgi:hypothetical protein